MTTGAEAQIDVEALRARYEEERSKRLRADGNAQFIEVAGEFAHYTDDPYTDWTEREAVTDEVDVAVLGAGFGGLMMAGRLREAGLEKIRVIDKAGDVGGTWYWNRYPGAQCDVESYIYLPLLEEVGYIPREKYSHGDEIREHAVRIARHFGLYDEALFQTEVRELHWDEQAQRWIVMTDRGDRFRARFVCTASGPMNRPKLPGIPGIKSFKGHSFHTSRWDYTYTGGSISEPMTGLADKRVGVIGTGATSLQIVPNLARDAKELYVFQRTPSAVDERNNQPTDPEWVKSLEPGWQKQRMENFNKLTWGIDEPVDLIGDGWTKLVRKTREVFAIQADGEVLDPDEIDRIKELGNHVAMEEIRQRVDAVVDDPATAESLKPYYRFFCKRPGFHDEYLAAFNRSDTTLVDTQGQGVEAITERGVVVDGQEFELDCLIFATGFEVGTDYTRRSNVEIYGRGGKSLTEHWASGTRTLHSYISDGFPNLFFLSTTQGGMTFNFTHMADEISSHVAQILRHALANNLTVIEAQTSAVDQWADTIASAARRQWGKMQQGCTPGYYNNEGDLKTVKWQNAHYMNGPVEFFEVLEKWRDDGLFSGLRFSRATTTQSEELVT